MNLFSFVLYFFIKYTASQHAGWAFETVYIGRYRDFTANMLYIRIQGACTVQYERGGRVHNF